MDVVVVAVVVCMNGRTVVYMVVCTVVYLIVCVMFLMNILC